MTGEISRWLTRARPWFAPDPWQASGQSEVAADVRAGGQCGRRVAVPSSSVSNLHVVGVGWNDQRAARRTGRRLALERRDGRSGVAIGAIGVAARSRWRRRTCGCRRAAAGPPRANGVAAFRTDLARLAAWRAAPGQPSPYQPQGMVTGNLRFDQQARPHHRRTHRDGREARAAAGDGASGASRAVPGRCRAGPPGYSDHLAGTASEHSRHDDLRTGRRPVGIPAVPGAIDDAGRDGRRADRASSRRPPT